MRRPKSVLIRRDGVRRDGRLDGARVLLALWREGRGQRAQEHTRQYFAEAGEDDCFVPKLRRDSRNLIQAACRGRRHGGPLQLHAH